MAQESCNIDKDEGEVLRPPSPSRPPATSPPSTQPPSPPSLPASLLKVSEEFPPEKLEALEAHVLDAPGENSPLVKSADCVNRCFCCRKRVGLTGFRCRCGHLFCPRHRYSDIHDCTYDYKAAGRAEISKNNPLIRASKIIKI